MALGLFHMVNVHVDFSSESALKSALLEEQKVTFLIDTASMWQLHRVDRLWISLSTSKTAANSDAYKVKIHGRNQRVLA